MRKLAWTAGAMALAISSSAVAADPVEGEWTTGGGWSRVRIAPCAGQPSRMCGNIVWLRRPNDASGAPLRDGSNPNPALRNRPLVGLPFITGFRSSRPGRWTGGRIYDPDSGRTYDSRMSLNPDGTLKVEGCVLVICQAQTWRRAR